MFDTMDECRRVIYGDDGATFICRCSKCGRYVKPDETMLFNRDGEIKLDDNATCSKCGRTQMPFEGFI